MTFPQNPFTQNLSDLERFNSHVIAVHATANLKPPLPIHLSDFATWGLFQNLFSEFSNIPSSSRVSSSEGLDIIPLQFVPLDDLPIANLILK